MSYAPQFWLATNGGQLALVDGPHEDRAGVERAAYIYRRLDMYADEQFACAEVRLTEITPSAEGVNDDAIDTINKARA